VLLNADIIIMIFVRISIYIPVFTDRVLFQYFYDLREQYRVLHDKLYRKRKNNSNESMCYSDMIPVLHHASMRLSTAYANISYT